MAATIPAPQRHARLTRRGRLAVNVAVILLAVALVLL